MKKFALILQFQNDTDCVIYYVILYLACFVVNTFMWYLSMLDLNNSIYLQDYRRHSVAVSQRRNDHIQVYIIITEDK